MKRHLIFALLLSSTAYAQPMIPVTVNRTVSLIFPYAVVHIDRGSPHLLAMPVREQPRVVLVKADNDQLAPTNLSVITEDGAVYTIEVRYSDHLPRDQYDMAPWNRPGPESVARRLLDNPPLYHGHRVHRQGLTLKLMGSYTRGREWYGQFELINDGPLEGAAGSLQFIRRSPRRNRRTARQEIHLTPIEVVGRFDQLPAYGRRTLVVVLKDLQLSGRQRLDCRWQENPGGRTLVLKLRPRQLRRARVLPRLLAP